MEYPQKRNLDGMFFRTKRGKKWENICFTDLTKEEQERVLEEKNVEWCRIMAMELARVIREMGDSLNLEAEYDD